MAPEPLVAVDASPATREVQTGTERYCAELCRRLAAAAPDLRFTFYASRPAPAPGFDPTVLPAPRLWSQLRLPAELWGHRPDLLFVPAHAVPYLAPGRATTVVHDLAFERYPEAYAPAERAYLRLTTRWACRRCRLLCAVSEATKRDLVELYGVDPDRITVVHNGLSPVPPPPTEEEVQRRIAALGVDGPYCLHVGRVEAKKNQATALEAVSRLPDLLLVSAGPIRDEELAGRLRTSPRARVLGRVPAADLEALYKGARALIFPSLYEGFGFPVLEAQQRGLPVVTARVSSLPEVGGDAAEYADDPLDEEEIAAALERALNRSRELAERGYAHAATFSWDRTAAGVADLLRRALA
ncbi:MAG TPA: glycosyltransferase family 1 protein [Candidatus Dormibacteraeota bacterium]|jgi:glycosyltransferase involved in cell wall biosynthesis|nr:glycosyltransferase family 1 protein [Candidatus Dormibacteraeota bacterium]